MREYHVELGAEAAGGKYVRRLDEPLLARTDAEAILIAKEIIRRESAVRGATTALLFDSSSAVVKTWRLQAAD